MKNVTAIILGFAMFTTTGVFALDFETVEVVCPIDMQNREACVEEYERDTASLTQAHIQEANERFGNTMSSSSIEAACPVDMQDRDACIAQYEAEFGESLQENMQKVEEANAGSTSPLTQVIEREGTETLIQSQTGELTAKPVIDSGINTRPPVLQLQNSAAGNSSPGSLTPPDQQQEKSFLARLFDMLFGWLR